MADERKHLKIWVGAIAAALIVVSVTGWFGRSFYRSYKERRSLAHAQNFFAKGDYPSALLSTRQVLVLDVTNVPALRIMADLADISRSPLALDYRQRIAELAPTVENKLLLASAGLHYQSPPFPLTAQILDEVSGSAQNLVTFQIVAAELDLRLHHFAGAETHLAAAARLQPTNQLFELNLAVVRLSFTNEATVEMARNTLKQFQSSPNLGAVALRSLIADRLAHKDVPAAADYSVRLQTNTQVTLNDRVQHLGILKQLQSPQLAAQLNLLQQQSATNALAVAEVAAWMAANDQLPDAIKWVTSLPTAVQKQSPVRLALGNSYLAAGDWRALRDFAARGKWDELEFLRLAFLAHAWRELGEPLVADSNWHTAVNEAGSRLGALTALLGLTERWQMKTQREDLLEHILQKFPRERWAQQLLGQAYYAAGNTAGLRQLYAALAAASPEDLISKNNLAATSLLLKTNLAAADKWAAEDYAQKPADPAIASTYAYALYLQGRTAEGVAALEKLDAAALKQPSIALYYGVLLSASGRNDEAARFLDIVDGNSQSLLPEEKRLLSEARKAR